MFPSNFEYLYCLIISYVLVSILLIFLALWAWRSPKPRKGTEQKAVLITGCDSGMGHRLAKRLDEMGIHVFAGCLNRNGQGATSLKRECSNRLRTVHLDITREDHVKAAVAYVERNLPKGEQGLYGLINNAGVLPYAYLDMLTTDMIQEVIDINLVGTIRVTKAFMPLLIKAKGRIITITSILARMSFPLLTVYNATKAGLNAFFTSLRYELQSVQVAIIEPGDLAKATNIFQWTKANLPKMWNSLTAKDDETMKAKHEQIKKSSRLEKISPSEQEAKFKYILKDAEDALLAEEPKWLYVSCPFSERIKLWFMKVLPEKIYFFLMLRDIIRS